MFLFVELMEKLASLQFILWGPNCEFGEEKRSPVYCVHSYSPEATTIHTFWMNSDRMMDCMLVIWNTGQFWLKPFLPMCPVCFIPQGQPSLCWQWDELLNLFCKKILSTGTTPLKSLSIERLCATSFETPLNTLPSVGYSNSNSFCLTYNGAY